jgi:hypothetical protein
MLEWVLILVLNGQYELQDTYTSETECQKAAIKAVEAGHDKKQRIVAGCYKHVSTTSYPEDTAR